VSFGAGQINAHAIQLFLFDRKGRYVRHYHSVVWDEAAVVADLRRLAAER
jgi:cytochrome oxidase Cu insertion factor (SCO1/SenC/PrrC family)